MENQPTSALDLLEEVVTRTKSPHFNRHACTDGYLLMTLQEAVKNGRYVKNLKKAMFYDESTRRYDRAVDLDEEDADIIHGILGILDEAGELADAVIEYLASMRGPNDRITLATKVDEEIGDSLWYQELLTKALYSSIEEAVRKVDQKLRVRYPEKFTIDDALNRDYDAEQLAMNFTPPPEAQEEA